jgi:hypothetical protein
LSTCKSIRFISLEVDLYLLEFDLGREDQVLLLLI